MHARKSTYVGEEEEEEEEEEDLIGDAGSLASRFSEVEREREKVVLGFSSSAAGERGKKKKKKNSSPSSPYLHAQAGLSVGTNLAPEM